MAERSASMAAAQVAPATAFVLQRKCGCGRHVPGGGTCAECARKRHPLQRKAGPSLASGTQAPDAVLAVLRSPGTPLDPAARQYMEPRFGRDFSAIRVHADDSAAASARAVGALAYTVGQHIVFAEGQLAPRSAAGRRLLAHELTHTLQQGTSPASLSPRLAVGAVDSSAEIEADRVADRVVTGAAVPAVRAAPSAALQRRPGPTLADTPDVADAEPDFKSPQLRGGRGRAASVDGGKRGDDQVVIRIIRYLCACAGRNVTRTRASAQLTPNPGVTLEICSGKVTARVTGDIVPKTLTTGTAKVGVDVNVAGNVNVGVQGQVQNTGKEPQAGGSADVRVKLPNGGQIGGSGGVLKGTQSGKLDIQAGAGYETPGGTRIGVQVTDTPGGPFTITGGVGGNLPGQTVSDQTCRECRCPVSYQCYEDIPPRDVQEPVTVDVVQRGRLRYYFSLDSDRDTLDPQLKGESKHTLDEVAQQVAAGSQVNSISGYASPEDNREKPEPNQKLSLSRARRLRDLLAQRLGPRVPLPAPMAGGELLGRVPTIAPGSSLADALRDVGFGDAEDVTQFLVGGDIPNPRLADQFLGLLDRVTDPGERLKLFGVAADSPAAPKLLAAIEQFRRNRGRGRRPWEGIFGYLRYATVELGTMHKEQRMEQHRTSGSLTPMNEAACKPYSRQAEDAGKFGPAEREPDRNADCPLGEPRNQPETAKQCNYD